MTFQVQTQSLRAHARLWSRHADDAASARETIAPAVGKGEDFGVLASREGVAEHYNQWTRAMDQALADAERCFRYIEAALESTAANYDNSDQTAATDMATLDAMI